MSTDPFTSFLRKEFKGSLYNHSIEQLRRFLISSYESKPPRLCKFITVKGKHIAPDDERTSRLFVRDKASCDDRGSDGVFLAQETFDRLKSAYRDLFSKTSVTDDDSQFLYDEDVVVEDGTSFHVIDPSCTFHSIEQYLCETSIPFKFQVNNHNTIPVSRNIELSNKNLQHVRFSVVSNPEPMQYTSRAIFICPYCDKTTNKASYLLRSTNGKFKCDGLRPGSTDACKQSLGTDDVRTETIDIYNFSISCEVNGEIKTLECESLEFLEQGMYEGLILSVPNKNKTTTLFLVSVTSKIDNEYLNISENIVQSDKTPVQVQIRRLLDKKVFEKTGTNFKGMYTPKELLITAVMSKKYHQTRKDQHNNNIIMLGKKGVGKSMLSEMYSPMLLERYTITESSSVSIPGLRGTRKVKETSFGSFSYTSIGALGDKDWIVIEEILENLDLFDQIKDHLTRNDYNSGVHAGSDGATKDKTATIIATGNINDKKLAEYASKVRKSFENLTDTKKLKDISSGQALHDDSLDPDKHWNDTWNFNDIWLESDMINNKYLREAVNNVRAELLSQEKSWICGNKLPNLDRFCICFYITDNKGFTIDERVELYQDFTRVREIEHDKLQLTYFQKMKTSEESTLSLYKAIEP